MLVIGVLGVSLFMSRLLLLALMVMLIPIGACTTIKPLSRAEVDAQWEDLLRREDYRAVGYSNPESSQPTHDKPFTEPGLEHNIWVQEQREMNGWSWFGLSGSGGWYVRGRREAELLIPAGVVQLYIKETTYWSPGFLLTEAGYDLTKYPAVEFRLVLRDPVHRQQMRVLHSVMAGPTQWSAGFPGPDGTVAYDAARHVVGLEIHSLSPPLRVEVAVPPAPERKRGKPPEP